MSESWSLSNFDTVEEINEEISRLEGERSDLNGYIRGLKEKRAEIDAKETEHNG